MKYASLVIDCPECGASVSIYLRLPGDNQAYCSHCYARVTVNIDVHATPQHKQAEEEGM